MDIILYTKAFNKNDTKYFISLKKLDDSIGNEDISSMILSSQLKITRQDH
jgi:hypothetical protein